MKLLKVLCFGYIAYAFLTVDMRVDVSYLTWMNNMKLGFSALVIIELITFVQDYIETKGVK